MTTRRDPRDTRAFGDTTTDVFPTVGDDEAQVVNASGAPSPNTETVRRPRTVTAPPSGQHVSHRRPVEINAETGQRLGTRTEKALSEAVGKLSIAETVDDAHPSERGMLEHIFGLNLPRARPGIASTATRKQRVQTRSHRVHARIEGFAGG